MKSFIWELRDRNGATLSFRATEKELRADRRAWKKHGVKTETVKVDFVMNRAGIARILNTYGAGR